MVRGPGLGSWGKSKGQKGKKKAQKNGVMPRKCVNSGGGHQRAKPKGDRGVELGCSIGVYGTQERETRRKQKKRDRERRIGGEVGSVTKKKSDWGGQGRKNGEKKKQWAGKKWYGGDCEWW